MFESIPMRIKLITAIMVAGIICILSINLGSYYITRRYFLQAAFESFTAIREIKKQQIESYFQQIRNQCHTFSQDTMIINAMKELKQAFYKPNEGDKYTKEQINGFTNRLKQYYKNDFLTRLNPNVDVKHTVEEYFKNISLETIIWQYFYIVANPNPTGQKDNLNKADDGSAYSRWHAKYHPIIREFLKKFGYYDIFLIDIEKGNIVYTVFKEVDYTTSLITGPFKNSNFAKVFLAAQQAKNKDDIKIVDFAYYDPSYGAPAAFIAAPIFDRDKKIGVLAFQFPIDRINQIMTNDKKWKETGLGNSGEMYLIGQDYKMRTVSRFLEEDPKAFFVSLEQSGVSKQTIDKIRLLKTTILIQEINTKAAHEVMQGNTGTILSANYRNIPVVSSFTPLAIQGLKWGLITEIDESEVVAPVKKIAWIALIWGLILLLLLIIFSIFTMRIILSPINRIIAGMRSIVHKKDVNLHEELMIESNDEVAELTTMINGFMQEVRTKIIAITTVKKELRTHINKMMTIVDPLQAYDAALHEFLSNTIGGADAFYQKRTAVLQAITRYQQSMGEMIQVVENTTLALLGRIQSNESMRRTIMQLQQHDQKLLAAIEKEIFDLRQTVRYLEDGAVVPAKSLAVSVITDAEKAADISRLITSSLHQATVISEEDRIGYQRIDNALNALKKQIESFTENIEHNQAELQQGQITLEQFINQLAKMEEVADQAAAGADSIIAALKALDNRINELDDIIKRFSW